MSNSTPTEVVTEQDKPFILALCTLGTFIGEVVSTAVIVVTHPTADISVLKDAITATVPLLSMAWTFYLVKKDATTTT